jgi:Tfp pilus assembly protein PilN
MAGDPAAASNDRRRSQGTPAKRPFWKMEIGRKSAAVDDHVVHETFVPSLPAVNLLPQAVKDSMAIGKIIRGLVVVGVLMVAVFGGIWYLQGTQIADAEARVDLATAENARLQKDVQALAPVKQMYEQITRLQDVVTSTLASQPQAAVVIDRLAAAGEAASAGGPPIELTSATVSYSGIPEEGDELNACPNPDPFGTDATIGCLTFNATAASREQVSALLRALEADPLFVGPYVTSTTATPTDGGKNAPPQVVAFSGSAGVSLTALETALTPEQIEAILTPPTPEPSASASPDAEAGTS